MWGIYILSFGDQGFLIVFRGSDELDIFYIGYFFDNTNMSNNEIGDLTGDDSGVIHDDPNSGGGDTPSGTGVIVVEP